MDSVGFWSTFQPKKLGWRSPYIGSVADPQESTTQTSANEGKPVSPGTVVEIKNLNVCLAGKRPFRSSRNR